MLFKTQIITKTGQKFDFETEKLNVPATDGRRTILSNHMAIMLPLTAGVIETENDGLHHYLVDDGILYFEDNSARIITDNFTDIRDIDIREVERKLEDNVFESEKQKEWYRQLLQACGRYCRN